MYRSADVLPAARVGRDSGEHLRALVGDHVRILVVEPDATVGQVAEGDLLAGRDSHGDATGAVAALDQLVLAGGPVVEGADRGDGAGRRVVGEDELDLGGGRCLLLYTNRHWSFHRSSGSVLVLVERANSNWLRRSAPTSQAAWEPKLTVV